MASHLRLLAIHTRGLGLDDRVRSQIAQRGRDQIVAEFQSLDWTHINEEGRRATGIDEWVSPPIATTEQLQAAVQRLQSQGATTEWEEAANITEEAAAYADGRPGPLQHVQFTCSELMTIIGFEFTFLQILMCVTMPELCILLYILSIVAAVWGTWWCPS